jgi:hypothetical protein
LRQARFAFVISHSDATSKPSSDKIDNFIFRAAFAARRNALEQERWEFTEIRLHAPVRFDSTFFHSTTRAYRNDDRASFRPETP